ncbi:DUF883 family protein [Allomeiothermus silvanus]|uniref:DUF883 family protein n=1 Tax=Allomeiothermus silvanus TaxID=52022 RepID=UPI0023F43896|nr:hypothetical protein [Allomeiothermus silvanus]
MKATAERAVERVKSEARQALDESGATNDMQALKDDLRSLRADVSSLMESLKGAASSKAKELGSTLKETSGQLGTQVKDALGTAREKGGQVASDLEARIQERPLMSVLVAFGVGLVLSRILSRR